MALSSCGSKIMETNECTTKLQSLNHCSNNIVIPEAYAKTKIYNDNKASFQWAASVTSKGINNLNLRENMVRGCNQSKDVDVKHFHIIINTSDIFTKEMKDNTHSRNIWDSMMVSLQDFLKYSHNFPSRIIPADKILPYYSIR